MDFPNKLFLSARINKDNKTIQSTIQTCTCLFVYAYCDFELKVFFVDDQNNYDCDISFDVLESMNYECVTKDQSEYQELSLALPAIETDNKRFLIAGVSGVLRWAIKSHIEKFPNHFSKSLLGFRGGCLAACAESSVWTNFCEVQLPNSVCEMKLTMNKEEESIVIPPSLVLLEAHLKSSDDVSKTLENLVITEKSEEFSLHHNYLEGIDLTLADMIAFPCVYYLLTNLPCAVMTHLEDVRKWLERMFSNIFVKKAATKCGFLLETFFLFKEDVTRKIIVPVVDKDSLYKRDPAHTKMRCKHKSPIEILTHLQLLEWEKLPPDLHPATGDLPQERIERKCQQIESMVTAVLKVAVDGQIIVEFCAGGGHVGLLLAYFLPSCKVILIENKESSIFRAKKRVESLNLKNVFFYQCNLDYFKGSFDLGVSLHACGVATDLVIQQCIKQRASFVCCPCCYGGVQNTHLLRYPLSKRFCSTSLAYEKYLFLLIVLIEQKLIHLLLNRVNYVWDSLIQIEHFLPKNIIMKSYLQLYNLSHVHQSTIF
ncbi:glutathione S-transferase C-terminal domain-containing protein homolog [Caerostris extrusa]|uniref:Glutathione S-transferase C-terminal domain-containing protein homolog n=1 Tax=Caerostris extrusa TaxID=172846 RepID=A0AAV4NDP5_CAEEX|nr:glutathione S-transferase C-terminal domain-containing protein homolog [Caerostris extrusa]